MWGETLVIDLILTFIGLKNNKFLPSRLWGELVRITLPLVAKIPESSLSCGFVIKRCDNCTNVNYKFL